MTRRPLHLAQHVRADGAISPLCAVRPRALALARSTWTLDPTAVTCPRCQRLLPRAGGVILAPAADS